jgi:hypothetical protein
MVVLRSNFRIVVWLSAGLIALAIYLALGAGSASAHAGHADGIHTDLAAASGPCGPNMTPVGDTGLCTHGPDPAPPGVNAAEVDAPVDFAPAAGAVCDGDGTSGNRIQVLYVRASDVPDRFAAYAASFRTWAQQADTIYQESARETSGERYLRFAHDSTCTISLTPVVIPPAADDDVFALVTALDNQGYQRNDRKYMVFVDLNGGYLCGQGLTYIDDSPGQSNWNNMYTSYAFIYNGCWADGTTVAHELGHALGAVQESAPNSTPYGHCTDEWDVMCYADGPGVSMTIACTNAIGEYRLDCGHNDYFHTNPSSGNYLYTHWNVASSRFLGHELPSTAKLTLDKEKSKYNGWVTAGVTGFAPNTNVNVRWPGGSLLVSFTTNSEGAGSGKFRTPLVPLGNYTVRAIGGGDSATDTLRVIPRIMLNSCDDESDYSGPTGECVRVYFYGFGPGDRVQIQWYTSSTSYIVLKTITIADNGRGTTLITIPLDATEGAHTIRGKVIGVSRSATTTFTVTGPGAAEDPTATATPTETATPEPSPTETGTPNPENPVDGTPVEETPTEAPTEVPTETPTEAPGTPVPVETATPEPMATESPAPVVPEGTPEA